jgi:hypothetical protein
LLEYADQQQWTERQGDARVAGRLLHGNVDDGESQP